MIVPPFRDVQPRLAEYFREKGALGVVLVDLSQLARIERGFGVTAFQTLRSQLDSLLGEAKSQGFVPNNFSIMPFDGGFNGASAQTSALTNFNSILQSTFGWDAATAYAHEGFSGMNGRSDTGEFFYQADFQTVLDYATRAVFERGASLEGRTVTLSGFTSPREGGGVRLTRMILTCCAADGRPVKITLSGDLPSKLKADTWIQVTGTYDKRLDNDSVNGEKIPYFKVDSLKRIPKPAQPYEE